MASKRTTTSSKKHFFKRAGGRKKILRQRKKATSSLVPDIDTSTLGSRQPVLSAPRPAPAPDTNQPPVSELKPKSEPDQPLVPQPPDPDPEKTEIEHTIKSAVSRLSKLNSQAVADKTTPQSVTPTPEVFNGVSSRDEATALHDQEVVAYQKKAARLQHEFDMLKQEFDSEKTKLEHTVRELKQELHRTAPLHDNKFFSLSKDLRTALEEIEGMVDPTFKPEDLEAVPTAPPLASAPGQPPRLPVMPSLAGPPPAPGQSPPTASATTQDQTKLAKKIKEKKLLISGVALLFILVSGAIVSYNLVKKPKVDQALVDNYLQQQGQIQGATTPQRDQGDKNAPDTPYENTDWKTIDDPFFGLAFEYPANVIERQRNGNGMAFLRKDGYLFKFQHVPTSDTLQDYWAKNKENGLSYNVEEITFKSRPTLFLELKDQADYPGNRFLVKLSDGILDIWYAIENSHFSGDDIKRAQHMVDTIRFLK